MAVRALHILLAAITLWALPALAALPPDARKLVDSLPAKAVDLDVVLSRSMGVSDSFKAVAAAMPAIDVPWLRSRAVLDWMLEVELSKFDDSRQPSGPFGTIRNNVFGGKLSLSKYFVTGTSLKTELSDGRTILDFVGLPRADNVIADAALVVSQNLWKDGFGYATRRTVRAGELRKKAAEHAFQDSVDDWAIQLGRVFYGAWLAQANAIASAESVKRREKLLRVTRTKVSRGTAEKPDLLQVESGLLRERAMKSQADLDLGNRWRDLVVALKLNEEWLVSVDPKEIPIVLDDPVSEALRACGPDYRLAPAPKNNVKVEAAALAAESAALEAEAARNSAKPSLALSGSLYSRGVDLAHSQAIEELTGFSSTGWALGLVFKMPLSQFEGRAAAREAIAARMRTEAEASLARDGVKLDWMKACLDLHRAERTHHLKKQSFENQHERARLDQQRFAIGRVPTITVVQSEDEATQAELDLRRSEVERRQAAWQVRRLLGGIKPYLLKLQEKASSVETKNEAAN